MQKSDDISNDTLVHDLSQVASQAYKELEITRGDLRTKELELKEIAESSNQKINAAVRLNALSNDFSVAGSKPVTSA